MEYRFRDASAALPKLMNAVLDGDEIGSRAGRVKEILFPHIVLEQPWRREMTAPTRNASLPAQIAETIWVLAGRNDVEFLSHYMPRAVEFSDDGKTWRGAYGSRLRAWPRRDSSDVFDQLAWVVDLLKADRSSRRAIISIYDPARDSQDGKDIPCNNWLHFLSRDGYLNLHVTIRSNDLMWGWSGINAFEWSALQEIVASLLGIMVGELHFSISSLHLYDRHWKKAEIIGNHKSFDSSSQDFLKDSPRFQWENLGSFDNLVKNWMDIEQILRNGSHCGLVEHEVLAMVNAFPEPMLRSWLQVIGYWWSKDTRFLDPLKGTRLELALQVSPQIDTVERPKTRGETHESIGEAYTPGALARAFDGMENVPLVKTPDAFVAFVCNLHAEKHSIYGDSWKKRGESGIIGNIARKVDRLGEGGAGDTAADTVIDMLVYMVKYRLWLTDFQKAPSPVGKYLGLLSDLEQPVAELINALPRITAEEQWVPAVIATLKVRFGNLERMSQHRAWGESVHTVVELLEQMIQEANSVARRLWEDDPEL